MRRLALALSLLFVTTTVSAVEPPAASDPYAFAAVGDAQVAHHPTQALDVAIDAHGVRLAGRAGGPTLAMRLTRVSGARVAEPVVRADAARVELRRGDLIEWYVHRAEGLEQGFTLLAPPPASDARALQLELTIEAHDAARSERDGTIVYARGPQQISVRGLTVRDATGRTLPSRMQASAGGLVISLDARGARYPIVVDPTWSQEARLTAASALSLGWSVAVSGDDAIVGDPGRNLAILFHRVGTTWSEEARFGGGGQWGSAVAIEGGLAAVGSPTTSPNGAVRLLSRTGPGGSWTLDATITPGAFARGTGIAFGSAISIAPGGGQIAIGAPREDATGARSMTGGLYVFHPFSGSWTLTTHAWASDAASSDFLGTSVAAAFDGTTYTFLVGAPGADCADATLDCGAAYVFASGAGGVQERQRLVATTHAGDAFGTSVALFGTHAVVGSPGADGAAMDAGSASTYALAGGTWSFETELRAGDAALGDALGTGVAMGASRLVLGASRDDCSAASDCGSARVFLLADGTWSEEATLTATMPTNTARLGGMLAMSGTTVVAGAYGDASAYVFTLTGASDGTHCTSAADCLSGFCTDGVCCASACSGGTSDCRACAIAAGGTSDGTCTALGATQAAATTCRASAGPCDVSETCVAGSTACPADAAAAEGTSCGPTPVDACDAPDVCAGTVGASAVCAAHVASAGSPCASPSCSGGLASDEALCDGLGTACPTAATHDCGAYVCGASTCLTACTSDADCAIGVCIDGACGRSRDAGTPEVDAAIAIDAAVSPVDAALPLVDAAMPADAGVDAGPSDAARADASSSPDASATQPPAMGGCACRAVSHGPSSLARIAPLLALVLVVRARSRRARARG